MTSHWPAKIQAMHFSIVCRGRQRRDNTGIGLYREKSGVLATLEGRGWWVRKRDRERKGKARCELHKERMVGALCGGVCDLKRTAADLHHCLKWERNELAWALVVCECIVVDEQMGKQKAWWVGGCGRNEGKAHTVATNEFPSVWIDPVSCQIGGWVGRL
jgi:hypothetical protein